MVFDVYGGFVVNFSSAMAAAKKQARKVPAFADFLKASTTHWPIEHPLKSVQLNDAVW